jgi:hypothetical protein
MVASAALLPQSYAVAIANWDEELRFLEQLGHDPAWREPTPEKMALALASARSIVAGVRSVLDGAVIEEHDREQLEELLDRADEVVDTLRWSAEAPEALRAAVDRECH